LLRNENSIKSETKPDRFLKPVRFGSKVSEVIKSSFLMNFKSVRLDIQVFKKVKGPQEILFLAKMVLYIPCSQKKLEHQI